MPFPIMTWLWVFYFFFNCFGDFICAFFGVLEYFFSPKSDYDPALFFQFIIHFEVAPDVAFNFLMPKGLIAFVLVFFLFPIFAVPKFAICKNGYFVLFNGNIGLADDGRYIFSES